MDFESHTGVSLSDGTPVFEDITIARGPLTFEQLVLIRDLIIEKNSTLLSRGILNDALPPESSLTHQEAISLFIGLRELGVADEVASGGTYADYTFEIDTQIAVDVLDQQLIAKRVLENYLAEIPDSTDVRLVVGLPPHIRPDTLEEDDVTLLGPKLRSMMFSADEVVRIANPYFDSSEPVISDIASLPNRGVQTKILTREIHENIQTTRSLRELVSDISPEAIENLEVHDLHGREQSGHHAYAVHAKVIITDRERCYIGSANLMRTSLSANFELGVLLEGPLVQHVIDIFDVVFDASESVDINKL